MSGQADETPGRSAAAGPGLPAPPAALASNGRVVVVADWHGQLLFWPWPGRPSHSLAAHGQAGALAVVGEEIASAGGWEPSVSRWEPATASRRFTLRPFDGRVTALAGQGERLLIAGADRRTSGSGDRADERAGVGDRVELADGRIVVVDERGRLGGEAIAGVGQIRALAAGADWCAWLDEAPAGELGLWRAGVGRRLALVGGATALTAWWSAADGAARLVVGSGAGLWLVEPATGVVRRLVERAAEAPRLLQLVGLGERLFGATSWGVWCWPSGVRLPGGRGQPVGLAAHGEQLLVLWEDGWLEERTPADLSVRRAAAVPRRPT